MEFPGWPGAPPAAAERGAEEAAAGAAALALQFPAWILKAAAAAVGTAGEPAGWRAGTAPRPHGTRAADLPPPGQPLSQPLMEGPAGGLRRLRQPHGAAALLLLLLLSWGAAQELSSRGRNVCRAPG